QLAKWITNKICSDAWARFQIDAVGIRQLTPRSFRSGRVVATVEVAQFRPSRLSADHSYALWTALSSARLEKQPGAGFNCRQRGSRARACRWLYASREATMTARWLRPVFITLATLAVCSPAHWSAQAQETLKVAIPQRGAWDAGLAELGQRGGIFKKHGLNLEILYVQAGPESIQALIGGSMEIATAAGVSAAVGTFAKGAPTRIIGSEMIGAPDLYWYVPANSPIKTVEDFNGKTVAYSLTGSSSHAALLALIAQY